MFASTISLYQENYGKSDPQCVAAVKNVYKELDLQVQLLLLQQLEVELLPIAEAFWTCFIWTESAAALSNFAI